MKICDKCQTKYNEKTVSECPICKYGQSIGYSEKHNQRKTTYYLQPKFKLVCVDCSVVFESFGKRKRCRPCENKMRKQIEKQKEVLSWWKLSTGKQ